MSRKIAAFAVALFLTCVLCVSNGYCYDFINSTQGYDAGVWFTSLYGNVNYTNALSFRQDMGLKQATGFVADADWRFNDKWGFQVNYFGLSTTGDSIMDRNTTFNNRPINRGDRIHSKITLSTVAFMVNYNVAKTEDSLLNVMAGGRFINLDLNIVKDPSVVPGFNFTLCPAATFVPAIGLSGKQRISGRIYLFGDFQGIFSVGGGDIKNGNMYDLRGGARWQFQEPGWYATFEWRSFGTKVNRTDNTSCNINWNGPAVTVRYEF